MDNSTTFSTGGLLMGNTSSANFNGTYCVEAVAGQSVHAGSKILDAQVNVVNCSENNSVKSVESSGYQKAGNVQPMQIPRVGCTVIVKPGNNDNVLFEHQGPAVIADNVLGRITTNNYYRGDVPNPVPTANLPSNWEIHNDVGSVTRVGKVAQGVHFNGDVHITQRKVVAYADGEECVHRNSDELAEVINKHQRRMNKRLRPDDADVSPRDLQKSKK